MKKGIIAGVIVAAAAIGIALTFGMNLNTGMPAGFEYKDGCRDDYILVGDICEERSRFTPEQLAVLMSRTPEDLRNENRMVLEPPVTDGYDDGCGNMDVRVDGFCTPRDMFSPEELAELLSRTPEEIEEDTIRGPDDTSSSTYEDGCGADHILVGDICMERSEFTLEELEVLMSRTPEELRDESLMVHERPVTDKEYDDGCGDMDVRVDGICQSRSLFSPEELDALLNRTPEEIAQDTMNPSGSMP